MKSIGLGEYVDAFVENAIDFELLSHLNNEDLKDLGINKLGDRKKLLLAIEQLEPKAEIPPNNLASLDLSTGGPSEAERRQLTVMFCDLAGSTALSTRLDPEDYREIIRAYQDSCAGVIARYDGYVAKFMGDGVLAYFGWPRGHEDDAGRAISAGLGVIEAAGDIPPAGGETEPLAVRIGIATGPVVVGDIVGEGAAQEAAVTGETPNLAARLQEIAKPNTIAISATTHALAGGLFAYETLGGQSLKGIDGSTEVWRVVGERQVESRFAATHTTALTPLIGREEELQLLSRRWERAKGGEGQVVLLSGEPGIGKSRLAQALRDWIGDEPHTRLLYQCSPHHTSSALYPIINQLEIAARFESGDDTNARLDKLEALLAQSGQPTDEVMPLFAALLSIPADQRYPLPELTPQQQKGRTLAALVEQLAGLAAQQPVLFVFEDAHWIDPTSLELMQLMIERAKDSPVLIVVTYRPEFTAPWVGSPHVSVQVLNRLTSQDCTQMAERLIGDKALPLEILAQIAERTDGVPLFVEELTRSVLESGATSNAEEVASATSIVIPATLQDALEARLDLSPAVRDVAQVGAAIGREFQYDLLKGVVSLSTTELDAALDDLTGSGLIFSRGAPPDASYTFKHALVQDTAYDSMVRSKRQETHKRIAEASLNLQPEITETGPEILAHHYTEAGLLEEAFDWWTRAGSVASAKSANPEAVALLQRGLELLEDLSASEARDRRELALQTALFIPLISVKGQTSTEIEDATNRALELCEKVDAPDQMFRAMNARHVFLITGGQYMLAYEIAKELTEKAERASDENALLIGHRMLGHSLFFLGRFTEAMELFDLVLAMFDRERHGHLMLDYGQDPEVIVEVYRAVSLWLLGWPDSAREAGDLAVTHALKLGHLNSLGLALAIVGNIANTLLRDIAAMERIDRNWDFMLAQHEMPLFKEAAQVLSLMVEGMVRPSLRAASAFREQITQFTRVARGENLLTTFLRCQLAEAYLAVNEPAQALELITVGIQRVEAPEEDWYEAEIYRLRGIALVMSGGLETNGEAEASMRKAIEVAKSQSAKSLELRAATSLARLWQSQGKTTEARDLLAPVYDWFTEGFDTPDLLDAKALLDELS